MVKVFVAGFPKTMEEIEIVQLFSFHGHVETIKFVRNKETGKSKGFAFLEMKDQAAAENVVAALNGTFVNEKELTVKIAEDIPVRPPKRIFKKPTAYSASNNSAESMARKKRPRKII